LVLEKVNTYNDILYELIIPKVFHYFYEVNSYDKDEKHDVTLVNEPLDGFFEMLAKPELVVKSIEKEYSNFQDKSFHLDHYCFDSVPEREYFRSQLLNNDAVEKIWFTGMFKHGQTEFYMYYIDPDSHTLRSYYPDFLVKKNDNTYDIIEIKGDNKIDDPVVLAKKEAAELVATASKMNYFMIKSSEILKTVVSKKVAILFREFIGDFKKRMFIDALPVYTIAAACGKFGEGSEAACEGWLEVKNLKLNNKMFIVKAIGHSMEPKIEDGDYCIFESGIIGSRNEKIVLAQHQSISDLDTGGSYTIKKYRSEKYNNSDETWNHKRILLESLNSKYPVIELVDIEDGDVKVIAEFIKTI
jgi:SOS-response transcriptional repressor LexA